MSRDELAEATEVLRGYGEAGGVRLRRGGNCAVYIGSELVLRVGRSWPLDTAQEMGCWRVARAHGVPAPEAAGSGELADGRPYLVYRHVAGAAVESPADLAVAGATLAALHAVPGRLFPDQAHNLPRRRARYATAVRGSASVGVPAGSWAGAMLHRAAADWRSSREVAAHGDFRSPNLVATRERIALVLDWTDARAASPESDLGQLAPEQLEHVLPGYRAHARRPPDLDLVAGHLLARHVALEVCGLFGPGTVVRVATSVRDQLDHGRWERA